MAGTERILIERLLKLSLGMEIDTGEENISDHLRACLLLVSSNSVTELPLAERISYETFEEDVTGKKTAVRGLAVSQHGLLLSDVIERLLNLPTVPSGLAEQEPELSQENFRAALYAIWCILFSLEWRESMSSHPQKFSDEKIRRLIDASLRSLRNYRETGEP